MRILSVSDFLAERVKVKPITNEEWDKTKDEVDLIMVRKAINSQSGDYINRKLRNRYLAASKYSRFIHKFFYIGTELDAIYEHVWNERFVVWSKLPAAELVRKHEQRAKMKLTEAKRFITVYCAFKMYADKNDYTGDHIIDIYMQKLKDLYGVTDKEIINVFFE